MAAYCQENADDCALVEPSTPSELAANRAEPPEPTDPVAIARTAVDDVLRAYSMATSGQQREEVARQVARLNPSGLRSLTDQIMEPP